jgi:beta-porphyranase
MNYHFLLLALGLGILGYTHAAPPPAPEGYMWVKNAKLTDEFNGTSLDSTKWLDRHPWWKGRAPAKFVPAAVSLNNGKLQIRNHMLSEPDGEYTIGCGAVVSKEPVAFY